MNAQVREEAAAWLVEFRTEEPDVVARKRFAAWLQASPAHVGAYLTLAAVWEDATQLDPQPDVEALIALANAGGVNVVEFRDEAIAPADSETVMAASRITAVSRRPGRRHLWATAAAIAAVATTLAWFALTHDPVYSTQLGEQRTLELTDGSTVELNARSKIRVRFRPHERQVMLLEGQALFNVVHNAARPFVVLSGATRVEDVGTQFAVAHSDSSTVVTVIEGRVAVLRDANASTGPGSAAVVLVSAGEQVNVGAGAVAPPHRANVATATAWTQQQLIFESTPLPEAADAFNRFNGRRLLVEGDTLKDFHVSGTFPARDPTSLSRFILFLRDQPGIEVRESDEQIVVRPK